VSTLKSLHRQPLIRRRDGRPAFTLLELIVVLLVLGILAAIAVPTFNIVKTNSAEKTFQASAEAVARNANAIAASGTTSGETTLGHVVTAAGETNGKVTGVEDPGVKVTLSGSVGSYSCGATITIVSNQAVVSSAANCGSAGGGGSAFQAQTTVWSWANWGGDPITTVAASTVCGSVLPVTPYTYGNDTDLDTFGSILGWEYSIDGAAFSQWMPTQTDQSIFGPTQPGLIVFWGTDGDFSAPENPSAIAMCALTSGQQIQFKTPSGLYSPILTIA